MADYQTFPQCLSGLVNAQHDVQHYFGCLRESEKKKYFQTLSDERKAQLNKESFRIAQLRSTFENTNHEKRKLVDNFKVVLEDWRSLVTRNNGGRVLGSVSTHQISRSASKSPYRTFSGRDSRETNLEIDHEAKVILFKESQPYTDPSFDGAFPNQSLPVQALLAADNGLNLLRANSSGNLIRYFHFPANNMAWAEEAVARYYGEKHNNPGEQELNTANLRHKNDAFSQAVSERQRSEVQRVLSTEIWRGQQHGKRSDPVHARFMRPRCSTIPKERMLSPDSSTDDVVLFLPYLHWETDVCRLKQANIIKEERDERHGVPQTSIANIVDVSMRSTPSRSRSTEHLAPMYIPLPQLQFTQRPVLGKLLLLSAKLADAMNDYSEENLLRSNLFRDPPLHPRRTLDQHFYWTLRDTERQDTSQVIYRSTKGIPPIYQHSCSLGRSCTACQELIRKVPRLIMVDQLWLWILDETTIITCFPKRWGRHLYDSSDVHQSICDRLQIIGTRNEIHSAHDLALVIVDQCCGTFFNQTWTTTTRDLQPQLTELFASSISNITYKRVRAYDNFLDYIRLRSRSHQGRMLSMARHWGMVDLNHEVVLLQEIKDILNELKIIANIKQEQLQVVKSLIRHINETINPSEAAGRSGTQLPHNSFYEAQILRPKELETNSWKLHRRCNALVESIQDHIAELKRLEEHAMDTSAAINELLTLKQQQMGVVEAVEEAKIAGVRGEIALRQGRSILLFTIVTIIFLPLSFTASIFGMNSKEFNDGTLTLGEEFKYMFTVSFAIIFATFIAAMWLYGVSIPETLLQLYWRLWGAKRSRKTYNTYAVQVTPP